MFCCFGGWHFWPKFTTPRPFPHGFCPTAGFESRRFEDSADAAVQARRAGPASKPEPSAPWTDFGFASRSEPRVGCGCVRRNRGEKRVRRAVSGGRGSGACDGWRLRAGRPRADSWPSPDPVAGGECLHCSVLQFPHWKTRTIY